jgi:hypothetical protein
MNLKTPALLTQIIRDIQKVDLVSVEHGEQAL